MKESIIGKKSFEFSVGLVRYLFAIDQKLFNPIYKQLLRSGTSIGANVQEALGGQSKTDFYHKLHISQKEARETVYRLEILIASGVGEKSQRESFLQKSKELLTILTSIIITTRGKLATPNSSPQTIPNS